MGSVIGVIKGDARSLFSLFNTLSRVPVLVQRTPFTSN